MAGSSNSTVTLRSGPMPATARRSRCRTCDGAPAPRSRNGARPATRRLRRWPGRTASPDAAPLGRSRPRECGAVPARRWCSFSSSHAAAAPTRETASRLGQLEAPVAAAGSRAHDEIQLFARAREPDVEEPALLLQTARRRPPMRPSGKSPSSRPVRTTIGHSRPLALWTVIRVTPRRGSRCHRRRASPARPACR